MYSYYVTFWPLCHLTFILIKQIIGPAEPNSADPFDGVEFNSFMAYWLFGPPAHSGRPVAWSRSEKVCPLASRVIWLTANESLVS